MRRSDREITDMGRIADFIQSCDCCRLGFADGETAYIVPLSFGYEEEDGRGVLYFHGAPEGRKIELIRRIGRAGFELDAPRGLKRAETACSFSTAYQSVIGAGRVSLLSDPQEREHALACIMRHYTGRDDWAFPRAQSEALAVIRLDIDEISCKARV